MRERRFVVEQETNICKLYLDGCTTLNLSRKFNCGYGTIYNVLARNKIIKRTSGSYRIHKPLNLSKDIEDYLVGDILSDAHISRPIGNGNSQLQWGVKHKEYAEYLAGIYNKEYFKINIESRKHYNKKYRRWYSGWKINSGRNITFTELRVKWYPKRKKIIPEDLILTSKTCLHWYLGDGCLHKKECSITLHTNGFAKKDVNFLIKKLKKIEIKSTKNKQGKNFIIRISRIEARKFLDYIGQCPISCYDYKWDWRVPDSILRREENKRIIKEKFLKSKS